MKLILVTADSISTSVPSDVMTKHSGLLRDIHEDVGARSDAEPIPLPAVHKPQLDRVINYCIGVPDDGQARVRWTDDFLSDISNEELIDLVWAADYMNVEALMQGICRTLAKRLIALSAEDIRALFNLDDDLTPETKRKIMADYDWLRRL